MVWADRVEALTARTRNVTGTAKDFIRMFMIALPTFADFSGSTAGSGITLGVRGGGKKRLSAKRRQRATDCPDLSTSCGRMSVLMR
jgi:hypothetical protein